MNFPKWPFLQQLSTGDWAAPGGPAISERTQRLAPRTRAADRVVKSICPHCAVGCGQDVYVRDGRIIDIEGDPESPISHGCLCPKGAATFQLVTGVAPRPARPVPPPARHGVGDDSARTGHGHGGGRVSNDTREDTLGRRDENGNPLRRTMAIAHLGGATLDNEENYLIKKLFTALGIVQIENQARI